jgi:hypothetical protein
MTQIKPPSLPSSSAPEYIKHHFDCVVGIGERVAPLGVGIFEYVFYATHPDGFAIVFGRHRTRVRFRYTPTDGLTVQQADAPPSEWYPDWAQVSSEVVEWSEYSSSPYREIETILHERFAA